MSYEDDEAADVYRFLFDAVNRKVHEPGNDRIVELHDFVSRGVDPIRGLELLVLLAIDQYAALLVQVAGSRAGAGDWVQEKMLSFDVNKLLADVDSNERDKS